MPRRSVSVPYTPNPQPHGLLWLKRIFGLWLRDLWVPTHILKPQKPLNPKPLNPYINPKPLNPQQAVKAATSINEALHWPVTGAPNTHPGALDLLGLRA